MTSDWAQRAADYVAKRDAAIPQEYLIDLKAIGATPSAHTQERLPRPTSVEGGLKPDPAASASICPHDNVIDVPRKALGMQDVALTETPIEQLLDLLASSKLSSVRLTQAFLRRAILAHQLLNCCTEIFVNVALKRAQECDEYLAKYGKPIGLLHGLPVSLKDQFHIKGIVTTMGYVKDVDTVAERDSVITELLLRAGAVPFVRTNVPQSLMRGETDNNIFGRTANPYNRSFTSGGSSGGEGALVGLHGSPLGLGTDIGGSVRMPAAFNGLWGLRPSMHRIPYQGAANSMIGQHTVHSVIGPMSNSHEGLVRFMRAILGGRPWDLDPQAVAMPFNEKAYSLQDLSMSGMRVQDTQLCFAVEWNDGLFHPHPPITRALRLVKEGLLRAGHKVVDWTPYDHGKGQELIGKIYSADGGEDIRQSCATSGEPVFYNLMTDAQGHLPDAVSVYDSWQTAHERDEYRKGHLDHWNATVAQTGTGRAVDAIIGPTSIWAGCPHDTNDYVGYTSHWNLIDLPVVVVPVSHVDEQIDGNSEQLAGSEFFSELDKGMWQRFDVKRWHGMPICLSLIGKRLQDEELLGMARVVSEALRAGHPFGKTENARKAALAPDTEGRAEQGKEGDTLDTALETMPRP